MTLPPRLSLLSRAGELSSQSGPDPCGELVKLGASQSPVQAILVKLLHVYGTGVVRLERRILGIVDTSPSEMMLASLEPETLLAWCCAFFGMAQREALGWSCTGLGVTVAGRAAPVLWHARGTGSQTYFVFDVLVVSVFGGGGGGRRGAGYVWPRGVDVFL